MVIWGENGPAVWDIHWQGKTSTIITELCAIRTTLYKAIIYCGGSVIFGCHSHRALASSGVCVVATGASSWGGGGKSGAIVSHRALAPIVKVSVFATCSARAICAGCGAARNALCGPTGTGVEIPNLAPYNITVVIKNRTRGSITFASRIHPRANHFISGLTHTILSVANCIRPLGRRPAKTA